MTRSSRTTLAIAAAVVAAAAFLSPAYAQPSPGRVRLLDVPYLPQTEALCGGAAAAMVMRFWGADGIYAETFADLVDQQAGGIRGEDLIGALRSRGFDARSVSGDAALVGGALARRQPAIALIEDRPRRFHYVVIVGWTDGRVIAHDPARAPFRVYDEAAFVRAWAASGFWTLLAAPAARRDDPVGATAVVPNAPTRERPCDGMVDEAVRLAGAGDHPGARQLLDIAARACPADPSPWRELAGVHALRGEWTDAAADAREALARDGSDQHAARILATSLYLKDDQSGALDAWNLVGEPVIDIIDIRGLERTRFNVAGAVLGLAPQQVLTGDRLERARKRLDELPSLLGSRVSYVPAENGRARLIASVVERPIVTSGALPLAALAVRALTDREATLAIASPSGGGEMLTASWRWWERRPRVAVGIAAPAPFGGIWSLEGSGERATFGPGSAEIEEDRRSVSLGVSNWITGRLRWDATAGFERWPAGNTVAIGAGLEGRLLDDRVRLAGRTALRGRRAGTRTWHASADWRSRRQHTGAVWLARAGVEGAGARAPLSLWPGAGTGQARDPLLRAHPLLHDGAIRDGVFGRRLAYAGLEWRRWISRGFGPVRLGPAVFVDAARAQAVPAFADRRAHVDVGAGLRIAVPSAGVLRADVARGLRDGEMALSFGWSR